MNNGTVYVVVDETTQKFRGVYPSLDAASAASVALLETEGESVLILPFEMYETSLRNKTITIEEIINGKNQ